MIHTNALTDIERVSVEEAIAEIREGRMIIVTDDDDRENEGDLVMAARHATPEAINFMARYARGLICAPMSELRLAELGLPQITKENTDRHGTAFTVPVDHIDTSTGISAADRALTLRALADPASERQSFRRPGHVFPLAARSGGLAERRGHTEATVELVSRALGTGSLSAGVICEIMNEDGTMARGPELVEFARFHGLRSITVDALARWAISRKGSILRSAETVLPTKHGTFRLYGYRDEKSSLEHVALVMGDIASGEPMLARVHSECLTGDALGSRRCDCGEQYEEAMARIAEAGRGILVYLRQEGRGIGLVNKLRAYALQDAGADTVEANVELGFRPDERDYSAGVEILRDLGVDRVILMTNNPDKERALEAGGIAVTERLPIVIEPNESNARYLRTKEMKMGHIALV